jgi:hypothetical protein
MSTLIEQIEQIASNSPGARVVLAAYKDLKNKVTEDPKVANSGPRIDEMIKNGGYNFPVYWCACAVTTWWQEAGLQVFKNAKKQSGSCQDWVNWAKKTGRWSMQPSIGAANIYFNENQRAHHIGIVARILPGGRLITIEGNTSPRPGDDNGTGVFAKYPNLSDLGGFVLPLEIPV